MTSESWLYRATREIRFVPDREAVRQELREHLADRVDAYMEQGQTLMEAEEAAVEAMGDPTEIAEELGRIHAPWWGYFWRASRVVLVLAVIVAVWGMLEQRPNLLGARPELPEGDIYTNTTPGVEWSVLEKWRPEGTKNLGGYQFSAPMAWLMEREYDCEEEAGETVHAADTNLMVCLRADTWKFWEPCSDDQYMVLANVVSDSEGELYTQNEVPKGRRGLFCETWREPFATWYLVWLYLPGPEDVPEWVDIPIGYGGGTIRVNLTAEVIS